MSASEEIVKNEPTSNEGVSHETGEDPDLELPPPVVTRTRSGRRVRTPAALLDSEVPSLKTPSRRRKSVIQEVPCETENPADPDPEVVVVEHIAASSKPTVPSTESEPSLLTKVEVCPKPAESDKPTDITSTVPHSSAGPIPDQCNEKENNARPVPKETAPVTDRPNKTAKKRTQSESSEKREPMIPLGKPKSGRVWKDRNKQRFSALLRDKPLRSSWERKMEAKREKELVKKYSLQLKEDKAREKEDKRKRREENLKRKEENERKSEVVQVIRNTTKIKRMKKKQLRKIEKRDTLAMLQKKPPRNPKPAGKGVKGDK